MNAKIDKHKSYLEFTFDGDTGDVSAEGHNMTTPFGKCVDKSLNILKEALGAGINVVSAKPKELPKPKIQKQVKNQQELG